MRKITLLLSFVACGLFAQGQLLLNENFEYVVGTELVTNSWSITGNTATPTVLVTTSSVTYDGYPSSGIGNEVSLSYNGQDVNKLYTAQTSGTIYTSFLVKVDSATLVGDYFFNVGANPIGTAFYGRIFVKKDASKKLAFGLQYTSTSGVTIIPTYSGFDYNLGTTYLIVLKYVIDGANSNTSIIINPAISSTEPTSGWIADAQGTQTKPTNIGAVALRQGGATVAGFEKIDGIRVATSWTTLFDPTAVVAGTSNPKASSFNATVNGKSLELKNVANGSAVEIFNALGAKVQSSQLVNGAVAINLTKGLYVVRVGKSTQKFMVK